MGDEHLSLAMEGEKLAMEGEQAEGNGLVRCSVVPRGFVCLGMECGKWVRGEVVMWLQVSVWLERLEHSELQIGIW